MPHKLTQARAVAAVLCFACAPLVLADEPPLVGGHPEADQKQADAKPVEKKQPEKKPADKKHVDKRQADKKQANPANPRNKQVVEKPKAASKRPEKPSNDDREQAALVLVREHHPDLVELLQRLKATKKKEYQQAVKELYRDSQRLENVRERDPERYGLELRAWQLDSRIRLLTARLSLEDRPELQEELKAALTERADVRLTQRELERDRLTARLKKLEEEISSLTTHRDEEVQRTFDRLLRTAVKARPAQKASGDKQQNEASGDRRQAVEEEIGARRQASGASKQALPTDTSPPTP
ncbi:MAG TPA: hypothetical protein VFI31_14495 [Pirellulales bacterium]|nr:hypothetical protein [Pirellulales bacterium]